VVPKASEGSRIVVDREKAAQFGQELEERKSGGDPFLMLVVILQLRMLN
jgi:hypothetical protein